MERERLLRVGPAGFSLMELMLVMTVTVVLTGLLLPALSHVRENAHRVMCSSNLRQTGMMVTMYADDHDTLLPKSTFVDQDGNKQEMMAAHLGEFPANWDGLGWLVAEGYCKSPEVFYCPSHVGDHPYERYREQYLAPGAERIYTNYQYAGHEDWAGDRHKRKIQEGHSLVMATDGLRSLRDFNHRSGINVLRGDISVSWRDDVFRDIRTLLRASAGGGDDDGEIASDESTYREIWNLLDGGG